MFHTRPATPADAALIAEHRQRMFADSGQGDEAVRATVRVNFEPWVQPRLESGEYTGWIVELDGQPIAGAGIWWMQWPPHFLDPVPLRPYLLNVFVDPAHRGHGLARKLVELAIEAARSRGCRLLSLHASRMGKPIYEKMGFSGTTEMMLHL